MFIVAVLLETATLLSNKFKFILQFDILVQLFYRFGSCVERPNRQWSGL